MGVFANAIMAGPLTSSLAAGKRRSGLGAWLLERLQQRSVAEPRLRMLERIRVTPRQTMALIEADGERFLVAAGESGAPVVFPLKEARRKTMQRNRRMVPEARNQ